MDARAEKSRWLESQVLMKARERVLKALKIQGLFPMEEVGLQRKVRLERQVNRRTDLAGISA